MTYVLPYPPTVNRYWRRVGNRTLVSRDGRQYRTDVVAMLDGVEQLTGPLTVRVTVYPPDRRRRDLDNILKSLLDALESGGAYEDDSQIEKLIVERASVIPDGRVVVELVAVDGHGQ